MSESESPDAESPTPKSAEEGGASSAFDEWQAADEIWQQRVAAGEDPGPRVPPPLPDAPDPESRPEDEQEESAEESRSRKWWRNADDAATCAACGCGLADLCDTNLRVMLVVLVGAVGLVPSDRVAARTGRPTPAAASVPVAFRDDRNLSWSTRTSLAALRWYKNRISAHTPAVCTQQVSCSAYAAQTVRNRGTVRAAPLIVRRLRMCAQTARLRSASAVDGLS